MSELQPLHPAVARSNRLGGLTAARPASSRTASPRRSDVARRHEEGCVLSDGHRGTRSFRLSGPAFLGHIVQHAIVDPRDARTLLVALRTGHLGPTVFRSTDFGQSWQEASKPPAFAKPKDDRKSNVVEMCSG